MHSFSHKISGRAGLFLLLAVLITFSGCGTPSQVRSKVISKEGQATFDQAVLARDLRKLSKVLLPVGETNVFSAGDSQAVLWVKVSELSGEHTIRWEWYGPKGELYQTTGDYTINADGKFRKANTSWHKIAIRGEKAEKLVGKWEVQFYLDNKRVYTKKFSLLPAEIMDSFSRSAPPKKPSAKSTFDLKRTILDAPEGKKDDKKWAVVIGVEKYRSAPPVQAAEDDAILVSDYFHKLAGVPMGNSFLYTNEKATYGNIKRAVTETLAKAVKEDDTIYFYFFGHSLEKDFATYLLPYDGDSKNLAKTAYLLDDLCADLEKLPAKQIVIFLDSAFYGVGKRQLKDGTFTSSTLENAYSNNVYPFSSDKIIIIAAAKAKQLSNYYLKDNHGMFTYYLLKGLVGAADLNVDRQIKVGEIAAYLQKQVSDESLKLFGFSRQVRPIALPTPLFEQQNTLLAEIQ